MMRYTMHLDGKSGYFENDCINKRFNAIPIKLLIPMVFFTELEQRFQNLYGNTKDPE